MYSPKISEDLIPALYRMAKEEGRPMTRIVDRIIREKLSGIKQYEHTQNKP